MTKTPNSKKIICLTESRQFVSFTISGRMLTNEMYKKPPEVNGKIHEM